VRFIAVALVVLVVLPLGPVVTVVRMPRTSTLFMVSFSVIVSTWRVVILSISLRAWISLVRFILAICWATIAGTVGFGVGPIRRVSVELGVAIQKLLCFTIVFMLSRIQAVALRVKVAATPACLDFLLVSPFGMLSIV
jgi:hypothetical protein